ncbi:MAG: hypothetical protein KBD19_04120 [Candidatus Moranbacteria bacterium]|nr:hypothetical protein [Candidatus Moranbacteria bacterium]
MRDDLEALRMEYEERLDVLRIENGVLCGTIAEIRKVADRPASTDFDREMLREGGEPMGNHQETDLQGIVGFPYFSEFYKIPVRYHSNFTKALRGMDSGQQEALKQALRRLAKRGYQATRPQQDHKKFFAGSKDLPVPQGARASKCGTLRYFWDIIQEEKEKVLLVYLVGKRGEVYRSER